MTRAACAAARQRKKLEPMTGIEPVRDELDPVYDDEVGGPSRRTADSGPLVDCW